MYTRSSLIRIVCISAAVVLAAANARAQDPIESAVAHVGVGAGVNFYNPTNNEAQTSHGVTLVYRWHSFHSGWGPTFGLDWHSTDFDEALGTLNAPLGSLRMRALLVGFGHTNQFGRFAVSGALSAGYTFNDFSVNNGAFPAFATSGVFLRGVNVDNSWVVKPDVAVWYDVFKHLGVGVSAAYLIARPDETITTAAGTQVRSLKADAFELTAGVTLGVWKKKE